MWKYIYISAGGALGAVLRYAIESIDTGNYHINIPLNTLIINISGCFALALFLTVAFKALKINADIKMGIAIGFFGAFTTFSTFCKETVVLMARDGYFSAILYITLSAMLGLAASHLGIRTAMRIEAGLIKETKIDAA